MGVDGKGCNRAKIFTSSYLVVGYYVRYLFGCILHSLGIAIWQAKLGKYGVHLGIVIAYFAKDIYNLAYGVFGVLGPLGNAYNGYFAIFCTAQLVLRNENVIGKSLAVGDEEGVLLFDIQCANKSVVGSLDDLCYFALGLGMTSTCKDVHLYFVAVKGVHRVALGYKNLFSLVGYNLIFAVVATLESSCYASASISLFKSTGSRFDEKLLLCHCCQHFVNLLLLCRKLQSELLCNLFVVILFLWLGIEQSNDLLHQLVDVHAIARFLIFLRHTFHLLQIVNKTICCTK